ncbi:MAG: peptide chain release factor 1 [Eubacteriales bacterium]|jgi:peptide chain release factor 1|nr:peptide chain release factor 1 [Eubacteriales bacterium]MDY4212325.1 peptide chain release factor 1 [Eubacteriales bacterium]MDY5230412.1 peptide chain release factor 1 [Eubacteriales bacterium]
MFEKLSFIEEQYELLAKKISDPEVIADQETWRKLCKEHSDMAPIVEKYREYKQNKAMIEDDTAMMDDPDTDKEFKEMLVDEIKTAKENIEKIEEELKVLLLPKDPNDDKNVIVEIRGGAGGDEAALFAGDLFRMYSMYADSKRWKTEVLNLSEIGIGGIKEVTFMIEGEGAYSRLKFESGVHRVQRVPETESSGRIHTSTVTVAVLPEVDEVEVEINPDDLQIDTYRSSGAGGQHVNKTESAIRITHIPTGIVVACQDERSQHKNREAAMKMLRSRLYEKMERERSESIAADRKSQVGTGDRSERIRTYNFPQGRMTDHRIGLTLYKLEQIMNGDLDEVIDALVTTDQSEKLKAQAEELS